jgi:acyl CoA:acetate/3-ketoacid CoA transferase
MTLEEVAPGIDLDKHINSKMGFGSEDQSRRWMNEYLMMEKWKLRIDYWNTCIESDNLTST